MSIGTFCSLCGGIFQYHRGPQPPAGPVCWAGLVRSVRGPNERDRDGTAEVTGLGYVVDGRVVARKEYNASYMDVTTQHDLETHELMFRSDDLRAFAFHEFCWQALLHRITATDSEVGKADPRRIGSLLFHALNSVPWGRNGALMPDNRYHGAINQRQSTYGRYDLMADPDESFSQSTQSLEELGVDPISPCVLQLSTSSSHHNLFQDLPEELIYAIFTLLPSRDVCSARLSSRRLAVLGSPSRLPPSFWASRFLPNREMGFVGFKPNRVKEKNQHWLHIYYDCKRSIETGPVSAGLRNRRRIWRCLEDFSTILSALIPIPNLSTLGGCDILPSPQLGRYVSCPELPQRFKRSDTTDQPIKVGTRIRNKYAMLFNDRHGSDVTTIKISSICLAAGEYISGIQIVIQSLGGQSMTTATGGVIMPSKTTAISLQPGDTVSSVDVFISTSGIHCLKFFITNHNGQTRMERAGNARYTAAAGLLSVTKLVPKSSVNGLFVGFDLYKAVSVQLIEAATTNPEPRPATLWNPQLPPDFPDHDLAGLEKERSGEDSSFCTSIVMLLGSPDGVRLSSLHAVTAFFYGLHGIYGLQFTYKEGDSILYGHRKTTDLKGAVINCVQQTAIIDGSNGERIIDVTPSVSAGTPGLVQTIQMRTNFGRQCVFGASNGHDAISKAPAQDQPPVHSLVVQSSAPDWNFQSIKTQRFAQVCPSMDKNILWSGSIPTTPAMVHACSLKGSEGTCFTTASLERVRRIHISMGTTGESSRSRNNISGLRIEYGDGRGDVIVGQWINERCYFELDPRERLTEITAWATTEVNFSNSVEQFGKIAGIAFKTNQNGFELRPKHPARVEQTCVRYRATPFEDLTSITWAFCSSMDDIQVRLKGNSLLSKKILVLSHSRRTVRAFDLAENNTRFYLAPADPGFNHRLARSIQLAMRYHYSRETFFFQEADENRYLSALIQVDICSDAHGKWTGLAFYYANNQVVRQGSASDAATVSLHLNVSKNEKLSMLLIFDMATKGQGIELRSSRGQVVRAVTNNEHIQAVAVFALQSQVELPSADSLNCPEVSHHQFPAVGPNGDMMDQCVGVWAVSRHEANPENIYFHSAGPIYMSDPIDSRLDLISAPTDAST